MVRAAALVPVLLALAVCVCAAPAAAGTFEFNANADTYVDSGSPKKVYGTSKRVWTNGDIPVDQTFVRFKVAGLTGTVTQAALRLYVTDGTNNGPAVFEITDSWSEKTTNWNNRPSRTSAPRDDKGALSAGRWVTWDVTPWVSGDGTVSFSLRGGAGNRVGLASRESARDPQLVVTTTAVDPPLPAPAPQCGDGLDNDGDSKVDAVDPGCASVFDDDETDPVQPPPGGEPGPIAGQGYHRVFRDDFDSLGTLNWGEGVWYDPGAPVGSIFTQNGILHLQSKRADGYPEIAVSTEGGDQPQTFTQGYFEASMNWTGGNGAWPAFWLLSYRHAVNSSWPNINPYCAQNGLPAALCYSAELDVFEGQGSEPSAFYGTIHRNSSEDYGVQDAQNANNYYDLSPTRLADQWHTYGMLWTASTIKWYLDGQLVSSAPTYDSTNQPMFLLFDMFIGGWTTDTDASTPAVLETQVDYVDVWQK